LNRLSLKIAAMVFLLLGTSTIIAAEHSRNSDTFDAQAAVQSGLQLSMADDNRNSSIEKGGSELLTNRRKAIAANSNLDSVINEDVISPQRRPFW